MPWRATRRRNSSCMTSTSWSTRMSGSSRVALAAAYSMIRSANSWRAWSRALRSSRVRMSARSASRSAKSPSVRDEVVVELGQDLLAQLAQLDLEVGRLAGQRRPRGSRPGSVMSNSVEPPTSRPTRFASKPGISRSSPRISGIRSAVPPSNGSPSRDADEPDDRVVAVLRAAVLDRRRASRSGRAAPR